MNDEEILKEYGIEIKQGIDQIVEDCKVTDPARIELVAQKYKESFIAGFKESIKIGEARGEEKKALAIAKNLLSQNIDINTISTATGLSVEKINKLKT